MKKNVLKQLIKSNSGVPYLKGEPGTAKTAILEEIAQELNLKYIDLRLSQLDEVEVIGLPTLSEDRKSFDYAIPNWVKEAVNSDGFDGSLIVFEELNRAGLSQRNAAMQILQERRLGSMKFPKNVHLAATGNLGESDGTDVEELDSAQNNRLLHIRHQMTINDWRKGFADKNVYGPIISFIQENPSQFLKVEVDKPAFASPRSWTFLSDFIINTYSKNADIKQVLDSLYEVAHIFVGEPAASKFLRYCESMEAINITDVLKRYTVVEKKIEQLNRSQISALVYELQELDFDKFKEKELKNISKFFKLVPDDEVVSILQDLVTKMNTFKSKLIIPFLKEHLDLLNHIGSFK